MIAGACAGFEAAGGWGLIIGAFLLAAFGYAVGEWIESAVAKIVFFLTALIAFLINAWIRTMLFHVIREVLGGGS